MSTYCNRKQDHQPADEPLGRGRSRSDPEPSGLDYAPGVRFGWSGAVCRDFGTQERRRIRAHHRRGIQDIGGSGLIHRRGAQEHRQICDYHRRGGEETVEFVLTTATSDKSTAGICAHHCRGTQEHRRICAYHRRGGEETVEFVLTTAAATKAPPPGPDHAGYPTCTARASSVRTLS
jgi:hypothetical protein